MKCRTVQLVFSLAPILFGSFSAAGLAAPASPLRWRNLGVGGRDAALHAIALDPRDGRLAVGGDLGVFLGRTGSALRSAAFVGGVTDLVFGADGSLWIASLAGLWRLPRGSLEGGALGASRLADRSPGPGEASRRVRRLSSAGGLLALATDGGAYVSEAGRSWQRVDAVPPGQPVAIVALRRTPADFELWLSAGSDLWRGAIRLGERSSSSGAFRREPVPGQPLGQSAVDLVVDLPGARVAVLYPRVLAVLSDLGSHRWQIVRPVLPPGARAQRIAFAAGRFWLATTGGLLSAATLEGPWRRADPPAGRARVAGVAGQGDSVFAATSVGLLEGTPLPGPPPVARASPPCGPNLASSPDIRAVQRAALRYSGLSAERANALRRAVRRRGWLPSLSLRFGVDADRDRSSERDEAFLSGDKRVLQDRDDERSRGYSGSVSLSWELGDAVFNPEWVDLSRELRQLISLRDDVLDEVNQLYFERRGILRKLATPSGDAGSCDRGASEVEGLWARAQALRAGLDGWTGGWFSTHLSPID